MAVDNGKIVAIEPASRRESKIDPGIPTVRLEKRAIVPGFVDTHHHVTEPFAKAITCGEPAQMWKRIWMPLEEASTPETAYIAAKWTFFEALRGGFTTIVDHGIRGVEHTDAIQRAAEETGLRLVSSTGVYDLSDFETDATKPAAASTIDDALRTADDHVARTARRRNVTPSLACGTVQSNSGEMIKCLSDFCAEQGIVFQIHANEHTPEVHRCIERQGCRPIEYLHRIGALGPTTLIAHATLVTGDEIAILRDTDTAVSYNPVASQWKGNGVAPALDYARRGIRFGLGTDATRNDAFRLLDAAEVCQRLAYGMPNDDFSCGAGLGLARRGDQIGSASVRSRRGHRRSRAGAGGGFPGPRNGVAGSSAVLGFLMGTGPLLRPGQYRCDSGWRAPRGGRGRTRGRLTGCVHAGAFGNRDTFNRRCRYRSPPWTE